MSLDFGLFAKLIVDSVTAKKEKEKEKYTNLLNSSIEDKHIFVFNNLSIIYIILSIIFGLTAFILSWTCNTAMGYNTVVKTVFGSVAFVFGFTYIVLYLLLRWDVCSKIMRK
jgi:hypothetical protein